MTPESRWAMQTLRASDGLNLAYVVDDFTDPWKSSETVILLHAAMGSSKRFYAWVPHLARDFRVVRLELRGHGSSDVPQGEQLSGQRLAQDVIELASHLDAPRFHLAGSSAGAVIAQKVAIEYPDRVSSLALYASSTGIKQSNQDQSKWVSRIGEVGVAAFMRETIADRIDKSKVEPGFMDWFIAESARTPVEFLARFVAMMRSIDLSADVARIGCPTLAVLPGGDPFHSADEYRHLLRDFRNCEFLVYEGLPHNITDAVPDRCAQDLRQFLVKHKQAA
ncbi:MAG: alpha/beta hydrolase [Casimicrobiaceae bacterium]